MFIFNGETTDEHGVVVQFYPDTVHAARSVTTVHVPGRSGDLVIDDESFENCPQLYDVYLRRNANGTCAAAANVARWLLSPVGYCRLEDSYDPSAFRLARFVGPLDVDNVLNRYGTATLEFDCKPQRFLKLGELPMTLTAPTTLHNPGMESLPLITVYGSGAGTVTVGGVTVDIKSLDEYVILDCDVQNAYKGLENKNNTIYAPKFPTLPPGDVQITWSGGVERVEIVPRWWTL